MEGQSMRKISKTFRFNGQDMYGFVPRTNGKPKTYFPTTSKKPNVLAGLSLSSLVSNVILCVFYAIEITGIVRYSNVRENRMTHFCCDDKGQWWTHGARFAVLEQSPRRVWKWKQVNWTSTLIEEHVKISIQTQTYWFVTPSFRLLIWAR
jgi:hypothetical protein